MSLRALLTRSFPFLRAQAAAAGKRPRYFHTTRDLDVGDAAYGGAGAAALFAGLVGIFFNHDKELELDELTADDAMKKKGVRPYASKEAAIELGFVFEDGTINWPGYVDHLNTQSNGGRNPLNDDKYTKMRDAEKRRLEGIEQECVAKLATFSEADEAVIKVKFQDWMKKYGKSYKNEKEKTQRYELFKKNVIWVDIANSPQWNNGHSLLSAGFFADRTNDELDSMDDHHGDLFWERVIEDINIIKARKEELAVMYAEQKAKDEAVAGHDGKRC